MKNFLSFKTNGQNSDKKVGIQMFKIAIIAIVCFIASLSVSALVSDRIIRNERALENIRGLEELFIPDSATYSENIYPTPYTKDTTSREIGVFSSTTVQIEGITFKKLGKQKVPILKGHSVSTGSFKNLSLDLGSFRASPSEFKKINPRLEFYIPIGTTKNDITLSIDGNEITDYATTTNSSIVIPSRVLQKLHGDSVISLSYTFTAKAEIRLGSTDDHIVVIHTNTPNIRLKNSLNSTFDKENRVATFDIHQGDYQTGIIFLSGADDITLVDRILKYAILFILLVFALALFIDLKKGLIISTLQYFLVGASLALFYLLTLALGEEIGYTYAYIAGTIGTVILNMWYMSNILDSKKAGRVFAVVLLVLYGLLYLLVRLDSISLLLGTGLLYVVLVIFMIASKKSNQVQL